MAQIWLTDNEIAVLFGLSAHAAHDQAIEAKWPFRRSSDGQMRFKVSDGAAHLFMIRYARQYLASQGEVLGVEDGPMPEPVETFVSAPVSPPDREPAAAPAPEPAAPRASEPAARSETPRSTPAPEAEPTIVAEPSAAA